MIPAPKCYLQAASPLLPKYRVWIHRIAIAAVGIALSSAALAIPATPLMTVYEFNGATTIPYYDIDRFLREGTRNPAGGLAQGSAVVPCLVVRAGKALTDKSGTPFVGFDVVVDASTATAAATATFESVANQRKIARVRDHHCPAGVRHVIDVRKLFARSNRAPWFDPPLDTTNKRRTARHTELDEVIRAFHASPQCDAVNRRLLGRRVALDHAWDAFISAHAARWSRPVLQRAKHLDFVLRTAIYEGHLDRGCSAYGACERNVITLSIRNRGAERCVRGQGCEYQGDFKGAASAVSQYNIWDELLTQTTGLTSCFLRPDLSAHDRYARLRASYRQTLPDAERILFGSDTELRAVFPANNLAELKQLRHYYHPPAMGACFPNHGRIEYISGAVATKGSQHALIANTRIHVDQARGAGYSFRKALVDQQSDRDVIGFANDYPGFVIDGRKVALRRPSRCAPYGIPRGCQLQTIGRHRKTPSWLTAGKPIQVQCRVEARGADCTAPPKAESAEVGGVCDKQMQPIAGVR